MQGLQGTPTPTRGGTTTGKLVDRWVTVTKKGRHRPAATSPPSTDVRNFRTMQKLRNIAKLQNLPGRTMFLHMQTKPTDDMVGRITVSGTIGELQQVVGAVPLGNLLGEHCHVLLRADGGSCLSTLQSAYLIQ